jgi:hypothetical protein
VWGLQRPLQVRGRGGQGLQLFAHLRVGTGPLLLDLEQFRIDLAQRVLQRLDQPVDRALPVVEIDHGLFLEFAERRLGQLEERLVVRA